MRKIWAATMVCLSLILGPNAYADGQGKGYEGTLSEHFIYIAHSGDILSVYAIDGDAASVKLIPCEDGEDCDGAYFQTGLRQKLDVVGVDPDMKYAYVANSETNDISAFSINRSTGALKRVACVDTTGCNSKNYAAGKDPNGIIVHPSGKYAYVANWHSDSVSAYAVNKSNGALRRIDCGGGESCNGTDFAAGRSPSAMAIHPSGRFMYVSNYYGKDITAYTLNTTSGSLTKIKCGDGCHGENYATGVKPNSIIIEPSGKFAYVANRSSNDITVFTINATTGALKQVDCGGGEGCNGKNFFTGDDPLRVSVDHTGKFAYVANYQSHAISAYTINSSTGALSPVDCGGGTECEGGRFRAGKNPLTVTIHPTNRFAYVANMGDDSISAYTVNDMNGALKRIACTGETYCKGSDFATGDSPQSVSVDPSGQVVYVPNRGDADLTAYKVNAATGMLTKIVCSGGMIECNGENFGGILINKRFDAARSAYAKGLYAESAKELQWVLDHDSGRNFSAIAATVLGYLHEIGLGVTRDMEKAEALYRLAGETNDRVLLLYDYESVTLSQWTKAFERTLKKAESGSYSDSYAIAYLYLYGLGVKKNDAIAAHWMKRAAEGANPFARYLLGLMIKRGVGLEQSDAEAKLMFQQAAALGSPEGLAALQSASPLMPEPYRKNNEAISPCANVEVTRQAGFPKRGQAEDFEAFRGRLRADLFDIITRPEGVKGAGITSFSNSIDNGEKGQALVKEITKITDTRRFVSPLLIMLEHTLTTACPVGYGGEFSDNSGRTLELWYVDFDPNKDLSEGEVFADLHLPAYGKRERKVHSTFVFTRDKEGRLMWYAFSLEMIMLLNYWYKIQFL